MAGLSWCFGFKADKWWLDFPETLRLKSNIHPVQSPHCVFGGEKNKIHEQTNKKRSIFILTRVVKVYRATDGWFTPDHSRPPQRFF